jgi:hypothetical protein
MKDRIMPLGQKAFLHLVCGPWMKGFVIAMGALFWLPAYTQKAFGIGKSSRSNNS